jgi:glycosyltransferase involved in cell wall biosynthesis
MVKISAVIITFNEQDYIGRCLSSLEGIADEIIVVDSFSTDSTESVCENFNVKFFKHEFEGYTEQKNYALSLAANNYVLSLDADEALSDDLKESVKRIKNNPEYDGYIFNRMQNYCGKWIKHSRWYPDRHLRLFNKSCGNWVGPNPHDTFKLNPGCRTRRIKGDLLHWNYGSIEEHIEKINRFSTISAKEYFKAGKRACFCTAPVHMMWSFFRSYILCAGFLEGQLGLVGCSITAYETFLKYSKLRKLTADSKDK